MDDFGAMVGYSAYFRNLFTDEFIISDLVE
jgi:hypothetical protein